MDIEIRSVLKELRLKHGYNQKDVAQKLTEYGIQTAPTQVSRWEKGHNNPNIAQFIGLCRLYAVRDTYKVFMEHDFSELSYELNKAGNDKVEEFRRILIASGMFAPVEEVRKVVPFPRRTAPLYDLGASAGTGQFLDSSSYEMVELPDAVPANVTFGLHVSGDSMEPTLLDGETIWVQMQRELNNGDIGVFYLDGNAFVKEYKATEKGVWLVSHNPAYEPIAIDENSDARVYGKVVYPIR